MIKWKTNVAGFAGNSKRWFNGVFTSVITAFTESIETPESPFSVIGLIDATGQAVNGRVNRTYFAVEGIIRDNFAVSSQISEFVSVSGRIDTTGQAVEGLI